MIIDKPEVKSVKDHIVISARIYHEEDAPDCAWFKIPGKFASYVSGTSDAFAVSLLPFAMLTGQDMHLKSKMSGQLYKNLDRYQSIINNWLPQFRHIHVHCSGFEEPRQDSPRTACCFSGGVDSFYTLSSLAPELSDAVFIHGLEIVEKGKFDMLFREYGALLRELGIRLIPVSTNISLFTRHSTRRFYTFGAEIIGTCLLLSSGISRLYIASSYDYSSLRACSSHPELDTLLSTSMQVVHHGTATRRIEKLSAIAANKMAQDYLRVCEYSHGLQNCCRCEKCIRTMIGLAIIGQLKRFQTFENSLPYMGLLTMKIGDDAVSFYKEMIAHSKRIGRADLAAALWLLLKYRNYVNAVDYLLDNAWLASARLKRFKSYRYLADNAKKIARGRHFETQ